MAAVPLSDTEVIVVESRRKIGYDGEGFGTLPGEGVLVYTVDAALSSGELPIKIGEDTGDGHIERSPSARSIMASGSPRTAKVSSSDSRSSGLMSTAAGEPLHVMTTRSLWALTRLMNSGNRSLTTSSDSFDIVPIVSRQERPGTQFRDV